MSSSSDKPVTVSGDPMGLEESALDQALARYRSWATRRQMLSTAEDDSCGLVSASDWQASDDEGVELAHCLADVLAR